MTFYTVPISFLLQGLDASPSLCFQYSSPPLNLGNLTDPGGLPLDFPLSYQSIKNSQIQRGLLVFPGGSDGKASVCNTRDPVRSLVGKIPWRRKWQPIPVPLTGKFHGQRRLVGYHPWGGRVRHNWTTLLTSVIYSHNVWHLFYLIFITLAINFYCISAWWTEIHMKARWAKPCWWLFLQGLNKPHVLNRTLLFSEVLFVF